MTQATAKVLDPRAAGARRLEGRIAIITGAGQGHGRATARRMAQEGAKVMIAERFEPGAQRTRDELRDFGTEVEYILGDMQNPDFAKELMKATKDRFGRIDILVNNVGGAQGGGGMGWEQTPENLEANIRNSLHTCLWGCWAVLPYMIEQRSGSIINFGSHAVRGMGRLGYAAAKGGVMAITTSLALEAAPYNVRLNCVVPHNSTRPEGDTLVARGGGVPTAPRPSAPPPGEFTQAATLTPIPLNRPGSPEEIASVVTFLASDDASFTTAEVICCGGGAFCGL
jgi:NAD(P)-dependent dehydrogenase (short-subunit alcohol dehydrogenase family)